MTTRAGRGWPSEVLWPAVLVAAVSGSVVQVLDVLSFQEAWSWSEAASQGVVLAVAMALGLGAQYRFSAVGRERAGTARAVTTGAVPEGADEEWSGRLRVERRRLLVDRASLSGISALGAVLVGVVALLPEGPGAWGWLWAVGLLLAGGLTALRQHRRLGTVDRLQADLQERRAAVPGGEPAHGSPLSRVVGSPSRREGTR